jgi:hypothetical protein
MSGSPSSRVLARGARGAVTWVTTLLILVVAVISYLGWVWAPLYLDNYAVRQAVKATMNEAIKNRDDAALIQGLCQKIRSIRTVKAVDELGRTVSLPAVAVDERNVSWAREDSTPPMLRVTVEYEREVVYPFLERTDTKTFVVEDSNDLTPVKW